MNNEPLCVRGILALPRRLTTKIDYVQGLLCSERISGMTEAKKELAKD